MIRFDSNTHHINLTRTLVVEGEKVSTDPIVIDLSIYDEAERQRMIKLAKIIMNFANGQELGIESLSLTPKLSKLDEGKQDNVVEASVILVITDS
jgi:hypothetical protein